MTLPKKIATLLTQKKKTLSVAESCTGGLLSACLTAIAGSSKFFRLGLVVYANEAKEKLLSIPSLTLLSSGAVSRNVAEAMAQNVRKYLETDFGLGITGIAGPSGGTKTKPVGLVYVAVSSKNKTLSAKYLFKGTRNKIRSLAVNESLGLLLKLILSS